MQRDGTRSGVDHEAAYVQLPTPSEKHARPSLWRLMWHDSVGHGLMRARQCWLRRKQKADDDVDDDDNEDHGNTWSALPRKVLTSARRSTRFYAQNWVVLQREILCGFAATLLQIPETIAFSYVANLDPLVGLYATGFLGVIIGVAGGVPATVAGAAGALAVVMPQLTSSTGALGHLPLPVRVEHLNVAIFLVGIFQLVFGVLELSRFFSMIPRTAHIGFLNGLAIMMFLSQMTTFKVCKDDKLRFGECEAADNLEWMRLSDPHLWTTLFTVLMTMAIMHFFPKTPRIGKLIPPTLVVALVGVGCEFGINRQLLHHNVRTIGDTSPIAGNFPSVHWPTFSNVEDWPAVLSCAASLAAVGIFESIMTLQAVVDLTKQTLTPAACRQECIANGVGNLVCGFFRAMGGCSMIGQSTGNVLNGARRRLSAIVGGLTMFAVIVFASPAIELVPVACLTGILFVIILHTFYWPSLRLIFHMKWTDSFAVVLVTSLAAAINLAVAVIAGVIWQCLVNGWENGQQLTFRIGYEALPVTHDLEHATTRVQEVKVYYACGNLLFSSISSFRATFDFLHDPSVVVIDLQQCTFKDFSAVAALKEALIRYRDAGKLCVARNLNVESLTLLHHDIGWASSIDILIPVNLDSEKAVEAAHILPEPTATTPANASPLHTPLHRLQAHPTTPSATYHQLT